MTRKLCLMALLLASFPTVGMAQAVGNGLNCRGLTGSAAAQCLQGVGPGRAASEPSLPGGGTAAGSEDATPGVTDSIRSFFNGVSTGGDSTGIGTGLNCRGLIGAAVAQCLQGVGPGAARTLNEVPGSARTANEMPRQDVPTADVSQNARSVGDVVADVVSSVGNFFSSLSFDVGSGKSDSSKTDSSKNDSSDGPGPKCQGLFGSAMARCLQGF